MPTKLFAALLLVAVLVAGTPVSAATNVQNSLTAEQQAKLDVINTTLENQTNHPLSRLWQIVSRTTLTGMFVDRMWSLIRGYSSQRELNRLNQLKEDRMNGLIKDARQDPTLQGKKLETDNVVAPPPNTLKDNKGTNATTPAPGSKPTTGSGVSNPTGGGGKSGGGGSIPGSSNTKPKSTDEDETKKPGSKSGSAVITSFNDGVEGMAAWFSSLFSK